MNQILREFEKQSGLEIYGLGTRRVKWEAAMERFAELIVKECIDIVSPYAIRMENFDGGHPIADLKKHFGVEE